MSGPSRWRNLLFPLIPFYRAGLALREVCLTTGREPIRSLRWPVVSVGNLSTGGAGKTPLTIALAKALTRQGIHVDVLSRGYGRSGSAPAHVNPDGTAEQFGDEPLEIAREAGVPVYVAAQRYEAGLLAEAEFSAISDTGKTDELQLSTDSEPAADFQTSTGDAPYTDNRIFPHARPSPEFLKRPGFGRATGQPITNEGLASEGSLAVRVHLLDDGFQHRQLRRNVDILLLTAHDLDDLLLPAGNLREPLKALRRATILAVYATEPEVEKYLSRVVLLDRNSEGPRWTGPVWRLHRRMEVPSIGGPAIAFCGIARPQQFFAGLESAGLHLASRVVFADHHRYIPHDIDCLLDAARSVNAAAFVTTEKDRVRLGGLAERLAASIPLVTAKLRIEIDNEAAAIDWLMHGRPSAPAQDDPQILRVRIQR